MLGWFSHVVLFVFILPLGAFCILRVDIVAPFCRTFNIFLYSTNKKINKKSSYNSKFHFGTKSRLITHSGRHSTQ